VKCSRSSPQRRQKWKKGQKAELRDGDRAVMLILDVRSGGLRPLRCSNARSRFRATIDRVTRLHDGPTELNGLKILAEEWEIVDVTCRWLKTYADATLELSLGCVPTASSAFLTFSWLMEDVKGMLRELTASAPSNIKLGVSHCCPLNLASLCANMLSSCYCSVQQACVV
jgi:hypothetical protein